MTAGAVVLELRLIGACVPAPRVDSELDVGEAMR